MVGCGVVNSTLESLGTRALGLLLLLTWGCRGLITGLEDIAEKIHDAFQRLFIVGDREMTLTLSIGVAMFPADGRDMDDLIKKSDESLYYVKNGYFNYKMVWNNSK